MANKRHMCFASGTVITKLFHLFCCCFFSFVDINRFNERIHESQRRNSIANNETVIEYGANSLLLKSSKLKFYDKHCFDSVIYLPFEDIQLPCPIGFDSILRLKYGDYMIPVKAKTNHGDVYIYFWHLRRHNCIINIVCSIMYVLGYYTCDKSTYQLRSYS